MTSKTQITTTFPQIYFLTDSQPFFPQSFLFKVEVERELPQKLNNSVIIPTSAKYCLP